MQVRIYAERYQNDPGYKGESLTLPTYKMAMENAKLRAGVAEGEGYSLELVGEWPDFLYYRKVLAEIKLCKLIILPKEGIENRR